MSEDPRLSTEDLAAGQARARESNAPESNARESNAPESGALESGTLEPGGSTALESNAPESNAPESGAPAGEHESRASTSRHTADEDVSLVDSAQTDQFRARWGDVQARFVDDPREAVGAADALVAELMQSLASGFAEHKSRLETQWHGGGEVDTEELRLALRRYRSFFHRLLET